MKPYLIIPKLIQQPTWGGTYISRMKGWESLNILDNKKIGQSYELFSGTKLAINIYDTSDPKFIPEIGYPDRPETEKESFKLQQGTDYINIGDIDRSMPLLIKINHSKGNSFQLHIKHGVENKKWKPKAESWYYLENGKLTFGIKDGIDINKYKEACIKIDNFMQSLSLQIQNGQKSVIEGRAEASSFVHNINPWQYVNVVEANKYDIVDPSIGGIHHSWEEDNQKYPLGNVVYEVQEDVMDPISTIRAFDQGKINEDGTVRPVHIEDYFKFLDTKPENNKPKRDSILSNEIYTMEVVNIVNIQTFKTQNRFHHLFVRDGSVHIIGKNIKLRVTRGHSVFIPKELDEYQIESTSKETVVLKAFSNK